MSASEIVRAEFLGESPDGRRFPITVVIGAPVPTPTGRAWRCRVGLLPLLPALKYIDGADSLQAMCLALATVVSALREFVLAGGAVQHANGTPCPLDAYLPP